MKLLSVSTSYDYYLKQGGTLSEKEYKNIAYAYLKFISLRILMGFKILLPGKMGNISITGRKIDLKFENGNYKCIARLE